MAHGLATEPHGFERRAHLVFQIGGQNWGAFGVLAFGGNGDAPRQGFLELAGIEMALGGGDGF